MAVWRARVSNEILLEYREVLERKTSVEVAQNIVNFITIHPATTFTHIYFQFNLIVEDQDDNKFVDCAIASNAVCIVSNDGHFRTLKSVNFPEVQTFTLAEFEAE